MIEDGCNTWEEARLREIGAEREAGLRAKVSPSDTHRTVETLGTRSGHELIIAKQASNVKCSGIPAERVYIGVPKHGQASTVPSNQTLLRKFASRPCHLGAGKPLESTEG